MAIASVNSLSLSGPTRKPLEAVLDDLGNSLPAAANHRLAHRHRFKVNATQSFVPAGQRKHCAPAHGRSDLLPRLAPEKAHSLANLKLLASEPAGGTLRTISDNFQGQRRKLRGKRCNRADQHFMSFDRNQVSHAEYDRTVGRDSQLPGENNSGSTPL